MSARRFHRLLEAAFRDTPTFRQKYDAHVKAYDAAMRQEVWTAYYGNPRFAAQYDCRRREIVEAMPRLSWGGRP